MQRKTYTGPELADKIDLLLDEVSLIKTHLVNSEAKKAPEYLTVLEWCEAAKCSRWVFDMLKSNNLIPYKRIGRKIIIPAYTAVQYLEGDIKLPAV